MDNIRHCAVLCPIFPFIHQTKNGATNVMTAVKCCFMDDSLAAGRHFRVLIFVICELVFSNEKNLCT